MTASKPRHTRRHQAPALLCLIVMLAACGGGGGGGNAAGPVANQPDGPELPEPPAPPETAWFDSHWDNGEPPAPSRAAPRGEWLATDTHVHSDHSSDGSIWRQASDDALPGNMAVSDQIGQARRQDLDFLALTDHRTYDQHWDPLWTSDRLLLIPGEEANGRPHANILGATDTILDGASPSSGAEHRPTQQSLWDAHGQGAVMQTNHPDRDWTGDDGVPNDHASTQGVDLIEVWNVAQDIEAQLTYAESRWNRGWETGITASSDNHFRELWPIGFGPGTVKTHVFAATRGEAGILAGLRAGHTVLGDGGPLAPMLTLEADAQGDGVFEALPGDAVAVPPGGGLALRLRVRRGFGHRLRLYTAPGRRVGAVAEFIAGRADQTFNTVITRPDRTGPFWVYAELTTLAGVRKGLTSPLFMRTGAPIRPRGERAVPESLTIEDAAALALGERGRFTGFPDVAEDQGGVPLTVAERHGPEGTDVVFRRGDGTDVRVLNTVADSARYPRIAAAGGTLWVIWQDERQGQVPRRPRIVTRASVDGGLTWGREYTLTLGGDRAIRPAVAALADGTPVLAWSDNRRRCFDLYVQVGLNGEAENLTADKTCDPGNGLDTRATRDPASLHPALTVLDDDTVVVAFQDNRFDVNPGWTGQAGFHDGLEGLDRTDPDNWEILARRRDPASGDWSPAVRVSNNGDPDDAFAEDALADRHPALGHDDQGRLVAAWDAKVLNSSGVNSAIFASVSEDGGLSWSSPLLVGRNDDAMSQRPALGRAPDGTVLAAWMDTRDTDWRHRIWGSRWTAENGWADARRLSGTGNGVWPRLAGAHLVFASDRGAAPQRDATWRVLHRATAPVGDTPTAMARTHSLPGGTVGQWRDYWRERGALEDLAEPDHDHRHP